jgi:hypothetical protein
MTVSSAEIKAQVGDLNRWAVHLDDPFSPMALADADKPYIAVSNFTFPDSMCVHDTEGQYLNIFDVFAKFEGATSFNPTCKSNICMKQEEAGKCRSRDLTNPLHRGFQKCARYILGTEVYTDADVILTYIRMSVDAGTGNEPEWHLDAGDDLPKTNRCLMGLLSNVLPTQVLLNPTRREDYEDGYLKRVMGKPLDETDLRVVTLPVNQLAVLPMSLPHRGQVASAPVERRDFMRWWVDK